MRLETPQELRVEASLVRMGLVEGESVELQLTYTNSTSSTQYLVVPDLQLPATIDFEMRVHREEDEEPIAELTPETLPETVESVHAEPEERALSPGDTAQVMLGLSPYLPALAPGAYTLEVHFPFQSGTSPFILSFRIDPLDRIRTASTVQDGRLVGLTTAYIASDGMRDMVLLEQLDDFTETRSVEDEWPVRYRRRVLEARREGERFVRALPARRSHAGHPWRHVLVEDGAGTWRVVTLRGGRPIERDTLEGMHGRPLPQSLLSSETGSLVFVTSENGQMWRYRYTLDEDVQLAGTVEGAFGTVAHMYADANHAWLLLTDATGRGILGLDLTAPQLRTQTLWHADTPIRALETAMTLDDGAPVLLIAALRSAAGEEVVVDVLRWSFTGRPERVDLAAYEAAVMPIRFALPGDGGCLIAGFEGGTWTARRVASARTSCYAVRGLSGEWVFTRGTSWLTLAGSP